MQRQVVTLLLVVLVGGSWAQLQARGKRDIGARIAAKVLQPKLRDYALPQKLLLTTVLACSTLACSTLYNLGVMEHSAADKAAITAAAVLDAQQFETGEGDAQLLSDHVYFPSSDPLKGAQLGKIVGVENRRFIVQRYAERHELTIMPSMIEGYLIDEHPYVGRTVRLVSDEVGFDYLRGEVFAVYSNGVYAVRIIDKVDFDGNPAALGKKFEDHIHLLPAYYIERAVEQD